MKIAQTIFSTLLVSITEAIQAGKITKYGFYQFDKDWEKKTLDALGDDFTKALIKSLDGSTFEQFVKDQLTLIQMQSGTVRPEKDVGITKLKCFSEPLTTARIIVESLSKIPLNYKLVTRVFQELGHQIGREDVDIKFSDRLRLVSGAKISPTMPLKHENSAVDSFIRRSSTGLLVDEDIESTSLYFEYRASGYLSSRRTSRVVADFSDEVRAFYGVCLAYGIMGAYDYFGDAISPMLIACQVSSTSEEFTYIDHAEEDLIKCSNLATSGSYDERLKEGETLETSLKPVLDAFAATNANKLKTACAWALRAHLSTRGLDKVLESAITIEVLMGDRDTSDRIGLTKLIANRCAYALGKSSEERDGIIDFFVQFYRVRSEVVHSGRTTLHGDERRIVNEGLALATRILKHEISLSAE